MYSVILLTCLTTRQLTIRFGAPQRNYGCQLLQGQRLQAGKPTEIECQSSFLSKQSKCFRHQEVASDLEVLKCTSLENDSKEYINAYH